MNKWKEYKSDILGNSLEYLNSNFIEIERTDALLLIKKNIKVHGIDIYGYHTIINNKQAKNISEYPMYGVTKRIFYTNIEKIKEMLGENKIRILKDSL